MLNASSSKSLKHTINPPVFFGSGLLVFLLVVYAVSFPSTNAMAVFSQIQASISTNVSWFYVLVVALILLTVTFLGISRYGEIKLGPDHAEPDFSFGSWFAMLFSAGMGIGLMFFGVSEPVMHFLSPPVGDAGSLETAKEAMTLTFFHWGLHAWAIYAIVALILAFFGYRHELPLTMRSALYPIIGDKIYGPAGDAIDIFAILGTVFGVATSLGLGVLQVNSGLNYLFDVPVSPATQVILIISITGLATLSVATGLDKGIRRLSEANLLLALTLVVLIISLGPTVLLLQMFVQNTGSYLSGIVDKTFNLYAYEGTDWIGGWTLFYWAFWLSWSPFVGMFIARISKGRTIREFVTGVLFVPTGLTFLWMTVFGNTAIYALMNDTAGELAAVVQQDPSLALFSFLEMFPFSEFLSFIAILMVVIFFVTSSDSSAMVIDILASNGNDHPPLWQRVFWSVLIGAVAMALMLAGGLQALQAATIASALPFSIILMMSTYGLLRALAIDAAKKESLSQTNLAPSMSQKSVPWQTRINNLVHFPRRAHVNRFNENVVIPAMEAVAGELANQSITATVEVESERIERPATDQPFCMVMNTDFQLSGQASRAFTCSPALLWLTMKTRKKRKYYRAEVFLREGGQDYDIMGWTQEQVIG